MKKFFILLSMLFCTTVYSDTLNIDWYIDNQIYQTGTCEIGGNVIPPSAPDKYGYTFQKWLSYIPIEYLESTGTQYIDTDYTANNNTGIKTKIQFIEVSNTRSFVFGGGTANIFELYPWNGNLLFSYGNSNTYTSAVQPNDILELNWNKNLIEHTINSFNKFSYTFSTKSFIDTGSMYLFSLHRYNIPGYIKVYYFQIYDNDILIHDFVPAIDPSNNTPCMFDKVENKFYYNQGTGQFIAGPIIYE